jgi:predicted dehydrogenase
MSQKLTRRGFLKTAALTAGASVLAGPRLLLGDKAGPAKLRVAVIGCGGRGTGHVNAGLRENLVALCDVDANHLAGAAKKAPDARTYFDFRELLAEMGDQLDAVLISTPDHTHAPAATMAMRMGKHVYVEKPLTHTIHEARVLTELAREKGVMTQMGNQGHSGEGYRLLCEWIWDGAIGDVREVHSWTDRPIWPQGIATRPDAQAPPEHLKWDLWLGPAPHRPFHDMLHPFKWRGWWDFGCGALGDMACHIMDGGFWALKLGYPDSVELVDSSPIYEDSFPEWSIIKWRFPAREGMPPVEYTWYDGKKRPPRPDELEQGRNMPSNGTLYIGEKGTIMTGCYGGGVRIIPETKMRAYDRPPRTIPRVQGGHFGDFFRACRDGKPPSAHFDYAGPFTETVLLGNLALRAGKGKRVQWDGRAMKVTNRPELNALVRSAYRKGWELQ